MTWMRYCEMINNKEKNFISAVVYLHNDERFIKEFVAQISLLLNSHFLNYELICVDDGSVDNTIQCIKDIAGSINNCTISIVKLNNHQGYEAAMNAGVDMAIGDYVIEFDSVIIDYNVSLIMEVYGKTAEGYDIVSASNKLYKRTSSSLFYNVFNKGAQLQYPVKSESFRIVSRRAVNKVYSMGRSVKYRKAFYANCGLKSCCIEYDGKKELLKYKESNKNHRTDTAATSLILFTNIAYKVSLGISLFMMFATVFMAVYAVATFITRRAIVGFTTTMLVMTGSFFAVFVLFAIVIKYLSIIVQMLFKKQDYHIETVEKISK